MLNADESISIAVLATFVTTGRSATWAGVSAVSQMRYVVRVRFRATRALFVPALVRAHAVSVVAVPGKLAALRVVENFAVACPSHVSAEFAETAEIPGNPVAWATVATLTTFATATVFVWSLHPWEWVAAVIPTNGVVLACRSVMAL